MDLFSPVCDGEEFSRSQSLGKRGLLWGSVCGNCVSSWHGAGSAEVGLAGAIAEHLGLYLAAVCASYAYANTIYCGPQTFCPMSVQHALLLSLHWNILIPGSPEYSGVGGCYGLTAYPGALPGCSRLSCTLGRMTSRMERRFWGPS